MSTIRNVTQLAVLFILAVILSAGVAAAQLSSPSTKGEFTLPHEVHWGKALLPPGDYSFTVTNSGPSSILTVRGNKQSTFVMTAAISPCQSCTASELVILNRKGERTVQVLRLAQAGVVLYYGPRREVDEALAQAPQDTERVAVAVGNK